MRSLNVDRPIEGVQLLDLHDIKNNEALHILITDQEEEGVWLAPHQKFLPFNNLEFDIYLMVFLVLSPFVYLGYGQSFIFGIIGLFLFLGLTLLTLNKLAELYKEYRLQRMDRNGVKKGILIFDDQAFLNNNGTQYLLVDLSSVDHFKVFTFEKSEYIEIVAQGKVIFERVYNFKQSTTQLENLLMQHNVKLLK